MSRVTASSTIEKEIPLCQGLTELTEQTGTQLCYS